MATKPKAILSTMDNREASPITKASNVLFENGQTAQDILDDRQDAMISPVIENSSSMFKVGQGDNVDYSANVVNGAYEGMVLKGRTMVNCIQEPSSQDVVLPYEFEEGRHVTINDTKESGALGVELKGQTLVNTLIYKHTSLLSGATRDGDTFTLDKSQQWSRIHFLTSNPLWEVNETYTTILYDVVGDVSKLLMCKQDRDTIVKTPFTNNKAVFVMGAGRDSDKRCAYIESTVSNESGVISFKAVVLKGDYSNIDIPFFTGMTSVKMPILKTIGKNLFNSSTTTDGYEFNNDTLVQNSSWFVSDFIKTKPNTTYVFSGKTSGNRVVFYDINKNKIGNKTMSDNKITTIDNCYYIRINGLITEKNTWQVEEGTQATPYEPYKTSILSCNDDVTLRGIGEVQDTLDCLRGEVTERIGEIVLDGSENWVMSDYTRPNHLRLYFTGSKFKQYQNVINSRFPDIGNIQNRDVEGVYITNTFDIQVEHSRLSEVSLDGFKQWLSQNPITVQYQLKTESIKTVDLEVVDQNGSVIPTLKSWNTTTHIYSEIPENSLHPILSHSNPTYPVILKPSTKYSIVANSYSNKHTNSTINFNLGGATASTTVGNRVTTITTPSTLTNEELVMSGRGNKLNNVMVIEGDVAGDLPYFEGICDCKSPILSNVGKNLFDGEIEAGRWLTHGKFEKYTVTTGFRSANIITITPSSRYTISGNFKASGYFVFGNKDGYVTRYIGLPSNSQSMSFNTNPDECYGVWYTVDIEQTETNKPTNIQLEEASTVTSYEPYKSNILSCTNGIVKLTEDMFEQGTTAQYTANIGKTYQWMKENSAPSYDARRLRLKELIKIQPNTKLILQNTDNFMYAIAGYDANKLSLGTFDTGWVQNTTITIPQDVYYISFAIRKKDDTSITIGDFKNTNFTLSEVDKTIVLRSLPNDVCDTLNVETGEYVQKIGEIVLNGNNDITLSISEASNNYPNITRVWLRSGELNNLKENVGGNIMCDKLPNIRTNGDYEKISVSNGIDMHIATSKLSEETPKAVKQYLSQNPITVQYELKTPIIKTIDVQGFPYAYANGHVQLSSGSIEQSLTPKVEYSVATNRNGQIRSNQKMVERHQKQLDQLQAIILANLVNSQYNQTLTTLKYELSRV